VKSQSFENGLDYVSMREAANKGKAMGRVAMIFVETPANPTNSLVDFALLNELADELAKEQGVRPVLACDNTMLGPVHQRVVPQGIDLAVYSLTKYIGGHSDLVAGAVCGSKTRIKAVKSMRGAIGLNLDPHTSWMISRSLETLTIRMNHAAESALAVAKWIQGNPYTPVEMHHSALEQNQRYRAVYERQCTGYGSTFSFDLRAPKATAFKLINALSIFKSAVSLGGTESLVCHPASTTHSGVAKDIRDRVGVTEGLIRLSIGM
jgi:methionine-gamma-lyase